MIPQQLAERINRLIELYYNSGLELLDILRTLEDGYGKRKVEELIKLIDARLNELTATASARYAEILGNAYYIGAMEAISGIAKNLPDTQINKSIQSLIHHRAVQAVMDESFYSILEATDNMSQDIKDRIQQVVQRANQKSLLQGVSRRQATKDAIAELSQEQIRGIVTKNGARVPVDKYMAGVVHYHQRKAHVTGAENMITQNGYDLVYVNRVGITCEFCAVYQGRVYSISGNDPRFPKLKERPPYHSHCVHSMSAWIEDGFSVDEVERMIQESNRPFKDNRTEANIRRYNEIQREKAKLNEDRKQWIRYRSVLGDDAPKSLSAYRKIKYSNNEKWQYIQLDYRRQKRLMDNPELKLPNADKAIAADAKFSKYLFNPDNKDGYAKGAAFSSRLGYNASNWKELQREIKQRAAKYPATYKKTNDFGDLYEQKIVIYGKKNNPANVVVGWIRKDDTTKMTSAYIKEVKIGAED